MKQTKTGLVLGKFAPLHKGHQLLIETALKQTDKVMVLIYDCPEVIDVPLNVRAGWIRRLYPQAKVIEAWDGPAESGRKRWIMDRQEKYIAGKVGVKITHFFSSEWYGTHVSRALNAKNVIVDRQRKKYPISGTKIRRDPFKYKKFVEPIVYRDLVKKIVFLGAESAGKSTIAESLAKIYRTNWMPEYGREYWEKNQKNNILTKEQLVELAEEHLRREEVLLYSANKFFFVDTNAITTEMFGHYYHGSVCSKLKSLAKQAEKRYDYVFVCDVDIPYEDDGTRSGEAHRRIFQRQIIADLRKRKVRYTLLTGNLEKRIKKVTEALGW